MSIGQAIARRNQENREDHLKILVPGYGEDGGDLVIFSTPVSARDLRRIQSKHKNFLQDMQIEGMVDLIILKALDQNGDKAFTLEDKQTLLDCEIGVVSEIAGKMFGTDGDLESIEKN